MPEIHMLGRYRIESYLGSGAHADVYRALDTLLDRVVALKLLKPALLADEQAFGRFLQEAKIAAGLMHPQIAWVWDLGQADGRFYIAMRYVDGPSLEQLLEQKGPLDWDTAMRLTGQVAEALEFAHQKGLVHRDVKPQNILVSDLDGAVLTDFGLVKAMQAGGLSTVSGAILGTPQYIPPEIWKGEPATPASDQYALACVLVEILTGKTLFSGPTPPAIMMKHFDVPLLPADLSEHHRKCLLKALESDPSNRYPSIREFMESFKKAGWKEESIPAPEAVPSETSGPIPVEEPEVEDIPVLPVLSPLQQPQPSAEAHTDSDRVSSGSKGRKWLTAAVIGAIVMVLVISGGLMSGRSRINQPTSTVVSASTRAPTQIKSPTLTQTRPVVATTEKSAPAVVAKSSSTPSRTASPTSTRTPTRTSTSTPSPTPTPTWTLKPVVPGVIPLPPTADTQSDKDLSGNSGGGGSEGGCTGIDCGG